MRGAGRLTIVLALVGLASVRAHAQTAGAVGGRITDAEGGGAVAGALVTVAEGSVQGVTDERGVYLLRAVPAGRQTLRVSRIGFAPLSREVAVRAGETTTVDIALTPAAVGIEGVTAHGEARAQREIREVRQSPFAVTVIDGQRLAGRGLTLDEALQRVTGLQVRRSGGLGSSSVFHIRGLEGQRVQIYIDGNAANVLGDAFTLDDIPLVLVERVEVYKGVVPARFGGDGLGAAINVVMRDLERGFDDVAYTLGSYGHHQLSAVVLRPLGAGFKLGTALNLDRAANDYSMESPFIPGLQIRRDHDRFRRSMVAGVLQYERGWFDELRLEAAAVRSSREIQGIQTNVQHAESGTGFEVAVLEADREGALHGRLDLHLGVVALTSSAEMVDTSRVRYTFDGQSFPSPNGRGELGLLPSHSDNRTRFYRHRAAATYRFSGAHTANLTYTLDHARFDPRDTLANRYAGRNVSEFPGRQSSAVVGLSHEWRPREGQLVNVLGVRGYAFRSSGTPSNIWDPTGERPPSVRNRSVSIGASEAVRYFVTPALLAKGSVELARRLPTNAELFGDGLLVQPAPTLRPERSLNLNAGVQYERGRVGNGQVQAELNVFLMRLRDMIRLAPAGFAGVAGHTNLGRARIAGFDAELRGDVTPWLHAAAGVTYQDARDALEHTPGTEVRNPTHGLRLPNLPWLFGTATLEAHTADLLGRAQRSRLFHELAFTGEYFYGFEMSRHQERRIPRSLTHTLGLEHQWLRTGLSVSTEVQNLTDARVMNQFNHPLPGRTLRVKVRYTRVRDDDGHRIRIETGDRR